MRAAEGEITATSKGRLLIGTGISLTAALGFGSTAQGAVDTTTVTSLADPGDGDCATDGCTLREAITKADDGDTADSDQIVFQSGLSGSINLNGSPLPGIDEPLYVDGPGAEELQIDALGASRIFVISGPNNDGLQVVIEGLRLTGGFTDGYQVGGGAIYSRTLGLELKNTEVTGNRSAGPGGAGSGGGVHARGPIALSGSTISGNYSYFGSGGGIYTSGPLLIQDSVISGNGAPNSGGGIAASAAKYSSPTTTIEDSTISNNQSLNYGGGLSVADRPATIRRSTVSGNHAQAGGGVNLSDRTPLITPTITHTTIEKSTISHNFSQKSGGVRVSTTPEHYLGIDQSTIADNHFGGLSAEEDSDVELIGTLVSDNTDFPVAADVAGENVSAGFSLIEYPGGAAIDAIAPNIIGSDPQLGPLAANGGPTQTMMPASTSPAIDQGHGALTGTDQRGQPRVFDVPTIGNGAGDGADIGALELQASEYVPPAAAPTGQRDAAIKKCKKKHKKNHNKKKFKKCKKKAKKLPV